MPSRSTARASGHGLAAAVPVVVARAVRRRDGGAPGDPTTERPSPPRPHPGRVRRALAGPRAGARISRGGRRRAHRGRRVDHRRCGVGRQSGAAGLARLPGFDPARGGRRRRRDPGREPRGRATGVVLERSGASSSSSSPPLSATSRGQPRSSSRRSADPTGPSRRSPRRPRPSPRSASASCSSARMPTRSVRPWSWPARRCSCRHPPPGLRSAHSGPGSACGRPSSIDPAIRRAPYFVDPRREEGPGPGRRRQGSRSSPVAAR